MEKELNELLLKDLCGRLPYGVKGYRKWVAPMTGSPEECTITICSRDIDALSSIIECGVAMCTIDGHIRCFEKYDIKPYLRPMSSMTEEEFDEFDKLLEERGSDEFGFDVDWLNEHHIDYRGLIPLNLAIAVTEENNPYKKTA